MKKSEILELKVGDKVKYSQPNPELEAIPGFGVGVIKKVSVNTGHIWVETDNPLLRGWYHDYDLEVVDDSQRTD